MRSLLYLSALTLAGCVATPKPCVPPGTQVEHPRAAGCMTVDSGKLLMVRTTEGWAIPGGYMRTDETSAQTAERETREEAGVTARVGPPICAVSSTGFVAHVCATPDTLPPPKADGVETTDARWMDRDEIAKLLNSELRFPHQRQSYLDILDGAAAAQQRLQNGELPPPDPAGATGP